MLDPNRKTRASCADILSHPWVQPQLRKISLEVTKQRKRRVGVCNSQSIASDIATKFIASRMAQCNCSCHTKLRNTRDSAFIEHCEECESISPIPGRTQLHTFSHSRKGTLSACSSGYASNDSLASLSPTTELETPSKGSTWSSVLHAKKSSVSPVSVTVSDEEAVVFIWPCLLPLSLSATYRSQRHLCIIWEIYIYIIIHFLPPQVMNCIIICKINSYHKKNFVTKTTRFLFCEVVHSSHRSADTTSRCWHSRVEANGAENTLLQPVVCLGTPRNDRNEQLNRHKVGWVPSAVCPFMVSLASFRKTSRYAIARIVRQYTL